MYVRMHAELKDLCYYMQGLYGHAPVFQAVRKPLWDAATMEDDKEAVRQFLTVMSTSAAWVFDIFIQRWAGWAYVPTVTLADLSEGQELIQLWNDCVNRHVETEWNNDTSNPYVHEMLVVAQGLKADISLQRIYARMPHSASANHQPSSRCPDTAEKHGVWLGHFEPLYEKFIRMFCQAYIERIV